MGHYISPVTFYKWRSKYGGMEASMVSRMKELEEEPAAEEDVCRGPDERGHHEGGASKKMVRPSQRREVARCAMIDKGQSIRRACADLSCVSGTCYRYEAMRSSENEQIAEWLMRVTENQRNWGFGLCFLYLRNVKGFGWNHKRAYRVYRELELNLRIRPKKRPLREAPVPLTIPAAQNPVWSLDFMHDALGDGRNFRLFNVLDASTARD